MKAIKEYLSNKIINKEYLSSFPNKPKISDFIEWLKENKFEELPSKPYNRQNDDIYEYIYQKRKSNEPFFIYSTSNQPNTYWCRFGGTGELNIDYPLFFIRLSDNGNLEEPDIAYIEYIDWKIFEVDSEKMIDDYEEFKKQTLDYFNLN